MGIHYVEHKPTEWRRRVIDVAADMFLEIFKGMDGTKLLRCESIPEDAHIVGLTVDEVLNTVRLYVESKEFEPVPEGCATPRWDLTVSTWTPRVLPNRLIFDASDLSNERWQAAVDRVIAQAAARQRGEA